MARPTLEEQLAAVRALETVPDGPRLHTQLRTALKQGASLVAARAAQIVRRRRLDALENDLVAAFDRFSVRPIRRDPSCGAKLAVLEALDALDHLDMALYARAARTVQLEPSWGPPVDTAAPVRARAALALGRAVGDDALLWLAELLTDDAPSVRRAAIAALAERGGPLAAALLVMRLGAEDPDPVARGECMAALVQLCPAHAVALLRPMLQEGEDAELVAYALAESRHPAGLDALIEWLDAHVLSAARARIIPIIAAHRTDAAETCLLALVEDASSTDAEAAVAALAKRAATEGARQRLREAAQARSAALARLAARALADAQTHAASQARAKTDATVDDA